MCFFYKKITRIISQAIWGNTRLLTKTDQQKGVNLKDNPYFCEEIRI